MRIKGCECGQYLLLVLKDEDKGVRVRAISALGSAFPYVTNKEEASKYLMALTEDKNKEVRGRAISALSSAFPYVTNKEEASKDLMALTKNKDESVRVRAISALGSAFPYVTNKEEASKYLMALTKNKDKEVRVRAISALGSAFPYVTNKEEASKYLMALTKNKDESVRGRTATALGSVFPYVTDKEKTQDTLFKLTDDGKRNVRISANHSLGRVSIYKATLTDSENGFREELKKALKFFEKASLEATDYNPASFCLPFYRSFHAITSGKKGLEADVEKYLVEAKNAVEGSESKEKLLEAVKNLSDALKEANRKEDMDFSEIKLDLNTCRRYCERTAELLDVTFESAPIATELLGKGVPIISEKISKKLEIQEKANAILEKTKGTPLESLGFELHEEANKLSQLTGLAFETGFDRLIKTVYKICKFLPETENKKCNRICDTVNLFANEKQDDLAETMESFIDIDIPKIKLIQISERKKDVIRIANVQINFELLTDTFPPIIKDEEKIKVQIFNALEKASHEGAEIVCLPELCVNENWLPEVKKKFDSMLIIPGTCYDKEKHNLCKLIMNHAGDIPFQLKYNPSDYESSRIMGSRMKQGEKLINIYETQFGKIAILICRDFGNFISFLRGIVDIVFVPSYNEANDRFQKDADNHVTNSPSYVILSNTAHFGGTSIFGQLDFKHFSHLEEGGCKKEGDKTYKLCEIEKGTEGMIIADLNLIHKTIQKPTPINPNEEILSVEYINKIELTEQRLHNPLNETSKQLSYDQINSELVEQNRKYVELKLGKISPEALEQIKIAYQRLSEGNPEAWSQALLSCRRILKSVADKLYPPQVQPAIGPDGTKRNLTEDKYISRLWQFVADNTKGSTVGHLLKARIQDLGNRIDYIHKLASKGVHAEVSEFEARQCVMQTHLLLGELLHLEDQE